MSACSASCSTCDVCAACAALVSVANATSACASSSFSFTPSVPLCIALNAIGGVIEVASTMCQAYPEAQRQLGRSYSRCEERLHAVAFLLLMAVASILYVVGSWFGPVSIAVPSVMVAKLLGNIVIMGAVLRMDNVTKEQQIGTYCITCAILTLPEIGPKDQPCIDAVALIQQPSAVAWMLFLLCASAASCAGMLLLARRKEPSPAAVPLLVYVTAQVIAGVVGASVAKMLALVSGPLLLASFGLAVCCAVLNVASLALAAKSCNQGIFIPFTTCFTLLINMLTGLLVWDEGRVISAAGTWMSYIMVHLIMVLGVSLLAKSDAAMQYRQIKEAQLIGSARDLLAHLGGGGAVHQKKWQHAMEETKKQRALQRAGNCPVPVSQHANENRHPTADANAAAPELSTTSATGDCASACALAEPSVTSDVGSLDGSTCAQASMSAHSDLTRLRTRWGSGQLLFDEQAIHNARFPNLAAVMFKSTRDLDLRV